MSDELWTDETLRTRYVTAFERSPDVHHWALLCELRDDYQARLRSVQAESDARMELANIHGRRMLEVEQELSDATVWGQACDDVRAELEARLRAVEQERDALCARVAELEALPPTPTYAHRNGEAEPPTERGKYWFYGYHVDEVGRRPKRRKTTLNVYGGVTEFEVPNSQGNTWQYAITPLGKLRGKWWGPITPPWKER